MHLEIFELGAISWKRSESNEIWAMNRERWIKNGRIGSFNCTQKQKLYLKKHAMDKNIFRLIFNSLVHSEKSYVFFSIMNGGIVHCTGISTLLHYIYLIHNQSLCNNHCFRIPEIAVQWGLKYNWQSVTELKARYIERYSLATLSYEVLMLQLYPTSI